MNLNKLVVTIIFTFSIVNMALSQTLEGITEHTLDSIYKQQKGINKVLNYYADSNRDPQRHKMNFTFAAAPYYKTETSLGLGAIASGLYKPNWSDSVTHISDISFIGKVTLTGFYSLEFEGNHNTSGNRIRLYYDIVFNSNPQKFWGIGFKNGDNNTTKTEYTRKSLRIIAKPLFKITNNFYAGPSVSYEWIKGINFKSDSLLFGKSKNTSSLNLGAIITYDSRDIAYNASRGIFLNIEQKNFVSFGGNKPFFKTIGDFRSYNRLWKGAVLALRLYAEFSYGQVPWTMKAKGDGSMLLRSYYEGRYADDNLLDATLELRQKIWKRLGAVVWAGAGNFYSDNEPFSWNHTLSDLGAGLRWEFKKNINLRIDYGIGRCGQSILTFGIREAF